MRDMSKRKCSYLILLFIYKYLIFKIAIKNPAGIGSKLATIMATFPYKFPMDYNKIIFI